MALASTAPPSRLPFPSTIWTRFDPCFDFYQEYRGGGRNAEIFIVDTGYPWREWMKSLCGDPWQAVRGGDAKGSGDE
ncbi:MAG: hypothetical protein ACJ8G3_25430 [Burkholderiaceae bacterium]